MIVDGNRVSYPPYSANLALSSPWLLEREVSSLAITAWDQWLKMLPVLQRNPPGLGELECGGDVGDTEVDSFGRLVSGDCIVASYRKHF